MLVNIAVGPDLIAVRAGLRVKQEGERCSVRQSAVFSREKVTFYTDIWWFFFERRFSNRFSKFFFGIFHAAGIFEDLRDSGRDRLDSRTRICAQSSLTAGGVPVRRWSEASGPGLD
jgi:hypothetical protein